MARRGSGARAGQVIGVSLILPGGWQVMAAFAGCPAPCRAPSLISVRGAFALCSGDMMRDRCDVRSHVVSEYVEGGWLMPGT